MSESAGKFKIKITTELDPSGADKAAESVKGVGDAAKKTAEHLGKVGEGAEKAGEKAEAFGEKFEHHLTTLLGRAGLGQLGELLHMAFNPFLLIGAGILEIFEQWKKRQEAIHEQNVKLIEDGRLYNETLIDGAKKAQQAQLDRAQDHTAALQRERQAVDLLTFSMRENVTLIGQQLQSTESLIDAQARLAAAISKNHSQGPNGLLPSEAAAQEEQDREQAAAAKAAAEDEAHRAETVSKAGRMPTAAGELLDAQGKAARADAALKNLDLLEGRVNASQKAVEKEQGELPKDALANAEIALKNKQVYYANEGGDNNPDAGPLREELKRLTAERDHIRDLEEQHKKNVDLLAQYESQKRAALNDYNSANELAAKRRELIQTLAQEIESSNAEYAIKVKNRDKVEAVNRQTAGTQIKGMTSADASAVESRAAALLTAPIFTVPELQSNIAGLHTVDRLLTMMEKMLGPGTQQGQLVQKQLEVERRLYEMESVLSANIGH